MVDEMIERFMKLQDKMDKVKYRRIVERFMEQKENAEEWRDQINAYFYRKSGISDEKGRDIY